MVAYYSKVCLSVTELNYENAALLRVAAMTVITLAIYLKQT